MAMETTDSRGGVTPLPPVPDLQGVLGRLLDEVEAADAGGDREVTSPDDTARGDTAPTLLPASPSAPPSPSPLGALLSNPSLLGALPVLAENLAPLLGSLSKGIGSAPSATRPHGVDRHTALLCAVKPYLSPTRREAAETVIRLCRVWDALDRAGIPLTGLLSGLGGLSSPKEAPRGEREEL